MFKKCQIVFTALLAVSSALHAADAIPGIGPAGPVKTIQEGFAFTEGPAWDGNANLYFSDIPNARIHRLDADGKVSTFTDKSGYSNGLMFNAEGELVGCEMDGQVVAWNVESNTRRILADKYNGNRFNAPNDLVIDRQGGIYFTDPHYRAPEPLPQGKRSVYYIALQGEVMRVIEDLPAPNGILLSLDEKTLYVLPSEDAQMRAYTVESPGQVGSERIFCRVKQADENGNGGSDGAALDQRGNLYLTTALGVQVFSPDGELLGIIEVPQHPANVTFGGPDMKTLFVTARTGLYAIPMEVAGHRFGATK